MEITLGTAVVSRTDVIFLVSLGRMFMGMLLLVLVPLIDFGLFDELCMEEHVFDGAQYAIRTRFSARIVVLIALTDILRGIVLKLVRKMIWLVMFTGFYNPPIMCFGICID
jgi:hypothetical protein